MNLLLLAILKEAQKGDTLSGKDKSKKTSKAGKESVEPTAKTTSKQSATKKTGSPKSAAANAAKAEVKDTGSTGKTVKAPSGTKTSKATETKAAAKSQGKKVDTTKSKIRWKGSEPAGSHTGTINVKKGKLDVDKDQVVGGRIVFDMRSVVCDETNEELRRNLKAHLEGPDFFDAGKYPEGAFEITSVSTKNGKMEVTGDLTLKGVTRKVTFPAEIHYTEKRIRCISSNILIDRTNWGIHYGSVNFFRHLADSFIDDNVEIGLIIETE